MEGAVVTTAERHRELVADPTSERARLHEAKVVRVRGFAAADEARLSRDKPQMLGSGLHGGDLVLAKRPAYESRPLDSGAYRKVRSPPLPARCG
jgi:hypothetical protein